MIDGDIEQDCLEINANRIARQRRAKTIANLVQILVENDDAQLPALMPPAGTCGANRVDPRGAAIEPFVQTDTSYFTASFD